MMESDRKAPMSCEAATRVKPKAKLCEGKHIVDESGRMISDGPLPLGEGWVRA
jgi:hypothetical protein